MENNWERMNKYKCHEYFGVRPPRKDNGFSLIKLIHIKRVNGIIMKLLKYQVIKTCYFPLMLKKCVLCWLPVGPIAHHYSRACEGGGGPRRPDSHGDLPLLCEHNSKLFHLVTIVLRAQVGVVLQTKDVWLCLCV